MRAPVLLVLLLIACSPKAKPPDEAAKPQPEAAIVIDETTGDESARPAYDPEKTFLVMLGTGTPIADPERSGPASAVVVGGQAYVVDCGPGVVRRATAAKYLGMEPLDVEGLDRLFITHLHSDHTAGYPDIILTPWVLGRDTPLEVYGPPGIKSMTANILKAYAQDIEVRIGGNQPHNDPGIQVNAHEAVPGQIYEDEDVKVTAFEVKHGAWEHAYGYRFDTKDRSIVISGDTVPIESVVTACNGCDILVHEVYAKAGFDQREPDWQDYHAVSHTSGFELGKIAAKAKPGLLVLTHQLLWGATEEELIAEIRQSFEGDVVYANDLDVF